MSTPVIGSQLVCGVSPTLDGNGKMVPVRLVLDDSFTPPRLVIELPDKVLRDLGRVRVFDGTTVATVRELGVNDALNVAIVNASGDQITSFGGGTEYAEDTAHVSGDQLTMAGVVQQAADAALSTDLDRSLMQVDGSGFLKVNLKTALPAGTSNIGDVDVSSIAAGDNNIGNVDIVSGPTGASALQSQGTAAQDAGAVGNPLLCGASAETMADSAPGNRVSTDGDVGRLSMTDGALFVIPTGPQTWEYHENSSSALTDAVVHAAPAAGLSLYVTTIVVSTGAATAFNIFFEETATTVLGPWYLEAVAGRGLVVNFTTPKQITAATALTVTTSAAIAHSIDITGFIAPG